jgi:diguanylate cyclase (GGDEF)-like protein/PAS domain S-box-containing protein
MNKTTGDDGLPADLWPVVFQNTQEAILISDANGNIVDVNPAFSRITGYSREEAVGQTTKLLKSGYQDAQFYKNFWAALNAEGRWQGEIWNRRKDGSVYPEFLTISSVPDHSGAIAHFIAIFYDISFVKEQAERFKHLAHHDVLTGLPNRLALNLLLPQAIARARRQGTQLVVAMLDLDDFKPINDNYGHKAGDDLLRLLGHRLKDGLRNTDFVARLGGDEFVILLKDLVSEEEIFPCWERVGKACESPFILPGGIEVRVGFSLGWTVYPDDDPNNSDAPELLLRNADMALYVAKADKLHRPSWHHRWGQSTPANVLASKAQPIAGYGDACQRLLRLGQNAIDQAAAKCVDAFYDTLMQQPGNLRILSALSPEEMASLKVRQAKHLRWLLAPELTEQAHTARACDIGHVHALIGVSGASLVEAMGIYLRILVDRVTTLPLRVIDRASLVQVLNIRFQNELQQQVAAVEELHSRYRVWFLGCAAEAGKASHAAAYLSQCIDALTGLPGIAAAAWGTPEENGRSIVRHASGGFEAYSQALANALDMADGAPGAPSATTVSNAWLKQGLAVTPSYATGDRPEAWARIAAQAGIRSSAAFPVLQDGEAICMVSIYGRYPAQFESEFMQFGLNTLMGIFSQVCTRLGMKE